MAMKIKIKPPKEVYIGAFRKVGSTKNLFYTDPDFVEHLNEAGYEDLIPAIDLIEEYLVWEKENTEPLKKNFEVAYQGKE